MGEYSPAAVPWSRLLKTVSDLGTRCLLNLRARVGMVESGSPPERFAPQSPAFAIHRCGQIVNARRTPLTTPIPLRFPTRLGRRPLLFDQFQRSLFVDQLPFTVVAQGGSFQNHLFRFFGREGWVQCK